MIPPYCQTNNLFITFNVPSSVMCVHVCAFMNTQWLDDDTFICYVYIYLHIHCYQDAPWQF